MESYTLGRMLVGARGVIKNFSTSFTHTLYALDLVASPLAGRPSGTSSSGLCPSNGSQALGGGECASEADLRRHGSSMIVALALTAFTSTACLFACFGDFSLPLWLLVMLCALWIVARTVAKTDLAVLDCQWAALIETPEEALRRPKGDVVRPASNQTCSAMPPPGEPGSRMTIVYTSETFLLIITCGWICAFVGQVILLFSGLKAHGSTEFVLVAFSVITGPSVVQWVLSFASDFRDASAATAITSCSTRIPRGP